MKYNIVARLNDFTTSSLKYGRLSTGACFVFFFDKHNCKITSIESPEELKQPDDICGPQEKNISLKYYFYDFT